MEADQDGDGKLSFEEFTNVVAKTVSEQVDIKLSHFSHPCNPGYRQADDFRASLLVWAGPGFISDFWTPRAFDPALVHLYMLSSAL